MRSRVARADSCEPSKLETALVLAAEVEPADGSCDCDTTLVTMGVGRLNDETVTVLAMGAPRGCESSDRDVEAPTEEDDGGDVVCAVVG